MFSKLMAFINQLVIDNIIKRYNMYFIIFSTLLVLNNESPRNFHISQ